MSGMLTDGGAFSTHQIIILKPAAFQNVDIRIRVSGGGHTSQIYAIRQALAKAIVAYTAKYEDAARALELKKTLVSYDRTLLVADPRRCEPKKFGGPGMLTSFSMRFRNIALMPFSDTQAPGHDTRNHTVCLASAVTYSRS